MTRIVGFAKGTFGTPEQKAECWLFHKGLVNMGRRRPTLECGTRGAGPARHTE